MALINLYKVTRSLTNLLDANIRSIDPNIANLVITAMPPELVGAVTDQLNLFLYHISEEGYYKTAVGAAGPGGGVEATPMALNLFYILTAHHEGGGDPGFDVEVQQKLMGYALKTFHDFPMITDKTRIEGNLILDDELQGKDNQLGIILRTLSPEDAIAFWGSEESRTVRLSAYYEVRVVMLEPEPPRTLPGIVLNLGAYLVPIGSPQLSGSESQVRFQLPPLHGGMARQVKASPARVTLDQSASPPEAHNRLTLLGSNLTTGQSRTLLLNQGLWSQQAPAKGTLAAIPVDPSLNPQWRIEFFTDRVTISLNPTLVCRDADGGTLTLPLLPGLYQASVRAVIEEKLINAVVKRIEATSNEISFAIAPRISGHSPPDGNGHIAVTLGGEFDLLDPTFGPEGIAIQVVVDGAVYERVEPAELSRPQSFALTGATTILINPHLPVVVSEPTAHALRLIVNGAEAAPFWIVLTP
jgi:hypothetical protein